MKLVPQILLVVLGFSSCSSRGETEIMSTKIGNYTITGKCRWITSGTVSPYVIVSMGDNIILETMVSPGYDTVSDCTNGPVAAFDLDKDSNELVIRDRQGEEKRIQLLGTRVRR